TFIQKLRQKNLSKPPGVAETLDWATALLSLGRTELTEQTVDETLGCLVKSNEDLARLRSEPSLIG
ncbi:MAG TPA: MoxR family ATPase, partial [Acidobacteriota bacterium]|nr:MoxR family ATPase [Acidobacteriota bacterium]